MLAARGVTGPLAALEAERGLRGLFDRGDARALLAAPMPDDLYIMRANVKMYPCLATGQAAVAAALRLREMAGGDIAALEKIDVVMADYPIVRKQQADEARIRPRSREAADHSFNFLVAVSLIDGEFGLRQYENERWFDPQVVALMARLAMTSSADLAARAPGAYPCQLRARHRDGRELVADVPFPPGFSRGGLESGVVTEKFMAISAAHAPMEARAAIVEAVAGLDRAASLVRLMSAARFDARIA